MKINPVLLIKNQEPSALDEALNQRLRCELWFGCESMTCRVHGCMNASGNHGGAAACPPPSSFIPCSTPTN